MKQSASYPRLPYLNSQPQNDPYKYVMTSVTQSRWTRLWSDWRTDDQTDRFFDTGSLSHANTEPADAPSDAPTDRSDEDTVAQQEFISNVNIRPKLF